MRKFDSTETEKTVQEMLDDMAREHFAIETRLYEDENMDADTRARLLARQAELVAGYVGR